MYSNHHISRVIAICMVITVCLFTVSVAADNEYYYFDDFYSTDSSAAIINGNTVVINGASGNGFTNVNLQRTLSSGTFKFHLEISGTSNLSGATIMYPTNVSTSHLVNCTKTSGMIKMDAGATSASLDGTITFGANNVGNFMIVGSNHNDTTYFIFSQLEYNGNPVVPPTYRELNYDLPMGNVLYIDMGARPNNWTYDLDINAVYPYATSGTFSYTPFFIGYSATLPDSNTSFPLPGMVQVNMPVVGNTDILGNGFNGRYIDHDTSLYRYVVIYNPITSPQFAYNAASDIEGTTLNIKFHLAVDAFAWALDSDYSSVTGVSANTGNNTSDSQYTVSYDADTDTWVTTDTGGNIISLVPGGNTNVQNSENTINAILQNLVKSFTSIFERGYQAITTLVNAGSAFINRLALLYRWIPSEVYYVLISAMIIVIIIGVIKVLL